MHNSKSIVVGANGDVYVAPVDSTPPTDATTPLAVAYKQLGFVSEQGVKVTPSQTTVPIMVWQSDYAARKIISARGLELDLVLRQFTHDTVPFAFGGGTFEELSPGHFKYTPPAPEVIDPRALVVDWQDGSRDYRLYVPNGQVTDLASFSLSRTAPAELPIKFEVNSDGISDAWTLFSNDNELETS